mmetsp:Transcript_61840/g.143917  ORF Transcript_61840/g.143917 Transcript_61840/m.143917 type:complete len:87 (-) Transcript_61840:41-301(-)
MIEEVAYQYASTYHRDHSASHLTTPAVTPSTFSSARIASREGAAGRGALSLLDGPKEEVPIIAVAPPGVASVRSQHSVGLHPTLPS